MVGDKCVESDTRMQMVLKRLLTMAIVQAAISYLDGFFIVFTCEAPTTIFDIERLLGVVVKSLECAGMN